MTDSLPPDNFLRISREEEIALGASRDVRFLGKTTRILRSFEGEFSAVDLVCRHQNLSLTSAPVECSPEGDIVTCPAHGWRYNLATGACLNEPWARLRRREVRVHDGAIYLALQALADDVSAGDGNEASPTA